MQAYGRHRWWGRLEANAKQVELITDLPNAKLSENISKPEIDSFREGVETGGEVYVEIQGFEEVVHALESNNAYISPKFGIGLIISSAIRVHDGMLLATSEALAEQVFGVKKCLRNSGSGSSRCILRSTPEHNTHGEMVFKYEEDHVGVDSIIWDLRIVHD
ncbi:hypothetical protein L6452_05341 [Arctium lappa]|uniref:Uncharacterized protein n=1 Tax=Arctium lappa TaxID=4217 RepID=A0ACB9EGT5_ARCLA|nr:hypothetical protein L6452_05341 [Arctium lappa]